MLNPACLNELRSAWLPNLTDSGLDRLIELLDEASPLLIHGSFTRAVPMGCLATHAAWHHPSTCQLTQDAGIRWLHGVAGLNPATSHIIREWDERGCRDLELRGDLLAELRAERVKRERGSTVPRRVRVAVGV